MSRTCCTSVASRSATKLSVVRCRSRRRSAGKLCNQTPGSQSSIKISKKIDEAIRQPKDHRDRSIALLWRRDEGYRQCILAGDRPLVEQQGQEFSPAISTARASHASLPENAKFAEIRRRSRVNPQPHQHGAPSLQTPKFQAHPNRFSCRAARSLCGIRGSLAFLAESGSHPSDTTALIVRLGFRAWRHVGAGGTTARK